MTAADAALVFGASGRLGKVMLDGLRELCIAPIIASRQMLADHLANGDLPALPARVLLVDASIDHADMRGHEAAKQALVADIALRHEIALAASFSSGVVDFDDALITAPSYRAYKQVKLDNLAFYRSLGARLFHPKIYTLIGRHSFAVKTTGWVQVLEQASVTDGVAIAHPSEPRTWVAEHCVQQLFASFVRGAATECLYAPACGTFRLADIVAWCGQRRGHQVAVRAGQATPWLKVPYVAPHPHRVDGCACNLNAELASLPVNPSTS